MKTAYLEVLKQLNQIDAIAYGRTRNFIDGAVTRLSPYLSRGVISLPMVKEAVLKKFTAGQSGKLLQELAWREYWQRVWEARGDLIFTNLRQPQFSVTTHDLPLAIQQATTGIVAIDDCIRELYATGYMHNHCRMYVAAITCNISKAHWWQPSRWLYYHLLDGDLASNSLSWQWVAGSFSAKPYFCNQENINKFCYTRQQHSFLDKPYDELPTMQTPEELLATVPFESTTALPATPTPALNLQWPTLIYNSYNLDPLWHSNEPANRILLLEPSHYQEFPVSEKVLQFILGLSGNIPGIQVFCGEFAELQQLAKGSSIIFKRHPAYTHYQGIGESPDYMFPQVSGYFGSFSAYWKKCERYLEP